MHSFKLSRRIALLALFVASLFSAPQMLFADVFGPSSCGDLYSTDLSTELAHEVDYRIQGLTAGDTTKKIFSTRGTDTNPWTRNASVWTATGTPLDLTGSSPWNSSVGYTKGGVLITPRHVVFAHHYPIATGTTLAFIGNDNSIVTRTLVDRAAVVQEPALDDIELGVLDSDVPTSTIAFYPIIPKSEFELLLHEPIVPFIITDQEEKALVTELNYGVNSYYNHVIIGHFPPPATSTRYAFNEGLVGGDSGKPGFYVVHGQPVLAVTTTGVDYGPSYSAYIDAINETILALGNDGGYQVSTYDLSCFDGNATPVVSDSNFLLPENSAIGTEVGTVDASDADGGDILSYAILSGNTSSAFSIGATSGIVSVANDVAIDYETNPTFTLIVEVSDDWPTPATATGTITITLEDAAEPLTVTTGSASVTGTSTVTLNGSVAAIGAGALAMTGFVHGTTISYGATTTAEAGDIGPGDFSANVSSLSCGATYHFKAFAVNETETAYGSDGTFTTEDCEVVEDDNNGGGGGGGGGGRKADTATVPSIGNQAELIALLRLLIAQFIALGGTPSSEMSLFLNMPTVQAAYSRDLDVGSWGEDVARLQQLLILQNRGPRARALATTGATGYFGFQTQAALAEFQASVGITPAVGYFGPQTRSFVASL